MRCSPAASSMICRSAPPMSRERVRKTIFGRSIMNASVAHRHVEAGEASRQTRVLRKSRADLQRAGRFADSGDLEELRFLADPDVAVDVDVLPAVRGRRFDPRVRREGPDEDRGVEAAIDIVDVE